MTSRVDLYHLLDELPDTALPEAERSLAALAARALSVFSRDAPVDDPEPNEVAALAAHDSKRYRPVADTW